MGYSYTNYSYGATCQGNVKVWNILNQIPDVLCGKPHSDQTHPTRLFYLLCASSRNKLQCITSQYYTNSALSTCTPTQVFSFTLLNQTSAQVELLPSYTVLGLCEVTKLHGPIRMMESFLSLAGQIDKIKHSLCTPTQSRKRFNQEDTPVWLNHKVVNRNDVLT